MRINPRVQHNAERDQIKFWRFFLGGGGSVLTNDFSGMELVISGWLMLMDLRRHSKDLLDVTVSWVCSPQKYGRHQYQGVIRWRRVAVELSSPQKLSADKKLSWSLQDSSSLTEILANLCVAVFTWEWANLTKVLTTRQGEKKWISRNCLKKRSSWVVDSRQSAQVISPFLWNRKSHSHLARPGLDEFSSHIHADSSVAIVTTI